MGLADDLAKRRAEEQQAKALERAWKAVDGDPRDSALMRPAGEWLEFVREAIQLFRWPVVQWQPGSLWTDVPKPFRTVRAYDAPDGTTRMHLPHRYELEREKYEGRMAFAKRRRIYMENRLAFEGRYRPTLVVGHLEGLLDIKILITRSELIYLRYHEHRKVDVSLPVESELNRFQFSEVKQKMLDAVEMSRS